MLEPMKKPRAKTARVLRFVGPAHRARAAQRAMATLGFQELEEPLPWRTVFPELTTEAAPGFLLLGARTKEGLSQLALAQQTGIPQRHISEMENGKRAIGKERAKTLAAVLKVDYRLLL